MSRLIPCMPPMMEEEMIPLSRETGATNYGGAACENLVKVYFLQNGINVAEPHVDHGVDLLAQKPGEGWKSVQVKKVVYQNKLDYNLRKRSGIEVLRPRYNFNFQGGGRSSDPSTRKKQKASKKTLPLPPGTAGNQKYPWGPGGYQKSSQGRQRVGKGLPKGCQRSHLGCQRKAKGLPKGC